MLAGAPRAAATGASIAAVAEGAWPTLHAATGSDVKTGDYYGPGGFMEIRGHPKKVKSNEASHNLDDAKRLWEVSEELKGVTYSF